MGSVPVKQLIRIALATAPLMALMFVTPIFTLTNGFHRFHFFTLWGLVTLAISFTWFLNIFLLAMVKQPWVRTWVRILVVGAIMFGVSGIISSFILPQIKIDRFSIEMIRLTNILAVNAIIFVLTDLILTRENKNKFELENSNLRLANLEAEYKLLKEQINPHFLFNALSTAKALVKKQPDLAEQYILHLSEFLRASINNNKKTIPLKEELAFCNEFIALNKIRFGNALQFENRIAESAGEYSVPYFSVLTLIENAIKHNQLTPEKPLLISVDVEGNYLVVTNTKRVKFVLKGSTKTGLANLNDRYKLLKAPEIRIVETDEQFSVHIALLQK